MTTSFTREVTIEVKAPPMIMPTARSITEPRLMNSLNSLMTFGSFFFMVSKPFWTSILGSLDSFAMRILYHEKMGKKRLIGLGEGGEGFFELGQSCSRGLEVFGHFGVGGAADGGVFEDEKMGDLVSHF